MSHGNPRIPDILVRKAQPQIQVKTRTRHVPRRQHRVATASRLTGFHLASVKSISNKCKAYAQTKPVHLAHRLVIGILQPYTLVAEQSYLVIHKPHTATVTRRRQEPQRSISLNQESTATVLEAHHFYTEGSLYIQLLVHTRRCRIIERLE